MRNTGAASTRKIVISFSNKEILMDLKGLLPSYIATFKTYIDMFVIR